VLKEVAVRSSEMNCLVDKMSGRRLHLWGSPEPGVEPQSSEAIPCLFPSLRTLVPKKMC
jgi:hypothetical protein